MAHAVAALLLSVVAVLSPCPVRSVPDDALAFEEGPEACGMSLLQKTVGARRKCSRTTRAVGNGCDKVVFLRIQKTGSTSLGEEILPAMCERNNQRCGLDEGAYHLEFLNATHQALRGTQEGRGCTITMLRDPIERTLSEFFYLWWKAQEGKTRFTQDQWDVELEDLPVLEKILTQADLNNAFHQYLWFDGNPSRNRQSLYLLGFRRVRCRELPHGCCGICEKGSASGHPARTYQWDRNPEELLSRAKAHLTQLSAFGITDCFMDSMQSIAQAVGWDPDTVKSLANQTHEREREWSGNAQKDAQRLFASTDTQVVAQLRHHGHRTARTPTTGSRASQKELYWSSLVRPEVWREVLAANSVDAELLAFARQKYYELNGKDCPGPSAPDGAEPATSV